MSSNRNKKTVPPPTVPPPTVPPPIGSPPEDKQQKEIEELKKQIEELKKKEESESRANNPESTNNQSIDSFKPLITGFLGKLKKETFFINEEITNTINKMVDEAIAKINEGNIEQIKNALKNVKEIIIKNKDNIPDNYKDKSKKYIDTIEKLDFDNLSNPSNINTIFNLGKGVATDFAKEVGNFIQANNNDKTTENKAPPGYFSNKINDVKIGTKQLGNTLGDTFQQVSDNLGDLKKTKEMDQGMKGLSSVVGNMGIGNSTKGAPPTASSALAAIPRMPQGMPQGMPGMSEGIPGIPGMPQGASGALGALAERFIIKKIDETFSKIQEQICATFSDYKKQIGKALIKKMVEKIEEHSTEFKDYTKLMYEYEANKSQGKSALNTSNVFYQIYNNVSSQIKYKQIDFKKMDFSDQIFSKYEAWKKEYDKINNNSLINFGGDILSDLKATYDAIPLPKDAEVKIKEGITRIMDTELIDKNSDSKQNGVDVNGDGKNGKDGDDEDGKNGKDGKDGDDEDAKDGKDGKKKSKNGKINNLDEAVIQSIEKINIPFTNAQMDLVYEKVFFGLHNPSVLIVKLLCNISDQEREQLIKDLTIQNTRDKMKEYYNEYMANKPGWPQRTKTIWEKIACNMNRHTDCPEDFKVPPLLEPLTGTSTGGSDNKQVETLGGYEKYIRKVRKTRRKRVVKKGKRKNSSYHRHGSV
jgi:hypothetical protein